MIKNLQKLFSGALVLISASMYAQPSLTGANTNPTIGENFAWKTASYVSPGAAGASQTWNLSSMTSTATTNYTVMTPGSTPYGGSFPAANMALHDGANIAYYNGSNASYLNHGARTGTVTFSYSNPETMLTYPFNYSNSLTDSWGCTFVSTSITFIRTGTSTITADGYGTCITPAGTFTNVMRLHARQVYKDSSSIMVINYNNDEYLWYRPGTHYPIAIVYSYTVTSFSTPQVTTYGGYLNNVLSGVEEVNGLFSDFSVFPNPASDELNLNINAGEVEKVEYVVCNSLGEQVKKFDGEVMANKESANKVNVADLAPGIYFLQVRYEGVLVKNEKFVVAR